MKQQLVMASIGTILATPIGIVLCLYWVRKDLDEGFAAENAIALTALSIGMNALVVVFFLLVS